MYASEMTPADIAACTGNNANDGFGFGGNGAWWLLVLILWGRGGYGGLGGGCGSPCATQADVRAAVDQQTLIGKIDQQTYGMADSFTALNNTLNNNFRSIDNALCTLGYQTQQGFNALSAENARCCCETQRLIERGFCDTNNTLHSVSRDIIDNQNANSRAILDFLTQDKITTLTAENQSLKFAASQAQQNAFITANQEAQTAELIRRLRTPEAVPAYMVPNPNCCYQPVSFNTNCGCNGFAA